MHGSWSVAICYDYIVIPSDSINVMSFEIMTGSIVMVDCFYGCIFVPESDIARVFLLE